jgi:hypothetical protein
MNSEVLPKTVQAVPALAEEPRQQAIAESPMTVAVDGVEYRIEPSHRYAIDGLVVSYKVHDGDHLLHRLWNDHLNVADVCVVWGNNVSGLDLQAFDFSNGEFTCSYRTRDEQAWRRFRPDQISNNHLITEDLVLRHLIGTLAVGDQVHLEGYLARYSNQSGFSRGTSTTRTDTGNGACETLYLTSVSTLVRGPRGWRVTQQVALWGLLLSAALWLVGVARGWI